MIYSVARSRQPDRHRTDHLRHWAGLVVGLPRSSVRGRAGQPRALVAGQQQGLVAGRQQQLAEAAPGNRGRLVLAGRHSQRRGPKHRRPAVTPSSSRARKPAAHSLGRPRSPEAARQ
jgi:hypothetical protein